MPEYFKSKKGYFYKKLKSGLKKRISQEEFSKKIKDAKILKSLSGGSSKTIQDEFINRTFERIQNLTVDQLKEILNELCIELNNHIILAENFEFTINIRSFLVINIILPFLYQSGIYTFKNMPYEKINNLKDLTRNNIYLGKDIKENSLTSLTPYPDKSLELINLCEDDQEYCLMNPSYLIIDYGIVEYLCNSQNNAKLKKIVTYSDLLDVNDGHYLYSILPNGTLNLFKGHHSAGACGQPVISAGYVIIKNNKIIKIDNSSGHYHPSEYMLLKGINILNRNGILKGREKLDTSVNSDYIKHYNILNENNTIKNNTIKNNTIKNNTIKINNK